MKLNKRPLYAISASMVLHSSLAFQSGRSFVGSLSSRQASTRFADSGSPRLPLCDQKDEVASPADLSRREALASMAAAAALYPLAVQAMSESSSSSKSLEDVELGKGSWSTLGQSGKSRVNSTEIVVPAYFATYAARFLINYDEGVSAWWNNMKGTYSLLSEDEQRNKLGLGFGNFAASVQVSINKFVSESENSIGADQGAWGGLFARFMDNYGRSDDAIRQICILFSLLPQNLQPSSQLQQFKSSSTPQKDVAQILLSEFLSADLSTLLPNTYGCLPNALQSAFVIYPSIDLFEVGVNEEFGQAVTATSFGPLSSVTLTRDMPKYTPDIYALFGISGATGCALTHSIVIPLDVVKTKAQTDPEDYANIFSGATRIVREEGFQGLLTGAQATLAGYFWYGLSVYPSYTFFKRIIGQKFLSPDFSALHTNDIALVAGALAAVIASLGLTPLEAARIRVVADPDRYKPLGLSGL